MKPSNGSGRGVSGSVSDVSVEESIVSVSVYVSSLSDSSIGLEGGNGDEGGSGEDGGKSSDQHGSCFGVVGVHGRDGRGESHSASLLATGNELEGEATSSDSGVSARGPGCTGTVSMRRGLIRPFRDGVGAGENIAYRLGILREEVERGVFRLETGVNSGDPSQGLLFERSGVDGGCRRGGGVDGRW